MQWKQCIMSASLGVWDNGLISRPFSGHLGLMLLVLLPTLFYCNGSFEVSLAAAHCTCYIGL